MIGEYYDREGKPISEKEWGRLFGQFDDYRRIGWDVIAKTGVEISTIWMGIDHNHMEIGPPIIFETMIFGGEHDHEQWRYATEEEARNGHRAACVMHGLVLVEEE